MGKDIDGALEIEEGVDTVSGGVLGAVLAANALGKRRIALNSRLQFKDAASQCGFAGEEDLLGVWRGGVDGGAGGEQEAHRGERVVGVLIDSAAHTA